MFLSERISANQVSNSLPRGKNVGRIRRGGQNFFKLEETAPQACKKSFKIKGELQRQKKLVSSERPSKILQNETKTIKIGQAVLEIFDFKDRDLDNFTRKTTEKPKMLFF